MRDTTDDAAFRRALLLITVAAIVVRGAFFLLEPATSPVADERTWTDWARIVAERPSPFRHKMIFHPPLYPYFLAGPYALTGSFDAAQALQVIVASLLVPAVGRVGAQTIGRRAGLAAAAASRSRPCASAASNRSNAHQSSTRKTFSTQKWQENQTSSG